MSVVKRKAEDASLDEGRTVQCNCCQSHLVVAKFSKSQINKLDYKKIDSAKCLECTEKSENDIASVRKVEQKKKQDDKKALERLEKMEQRPDPSLKYIGKPTATPIARDASAFFREQGVEFKIYIGPLNHWRTVAKIAVRGVVVGGDSASGNINSRNAIVHSSSSSEAPTIRTSFGLFAPGSHDVISCCNSKAHSKVINKAVGRVQTACQELRINGYVEGVGCDHATNTLYRSYLKYLVLSVQRSTSTAQLTIVWNAAADDSQGAQLLSALVKKLLPGEDAPVSVSSAKAGTTVAAVSSTVSCNSIGNSSTSNSSSTTSTTTTNNNNNNSGVNDSNNNNNSASVGLFHSIWVNYNQSSRYSNKITSWDDDAWVLLYGEPAVEEVVHTDMKHPPLLRFPPFVFRQANIDSFTNIIRALRSWIPKRSHVSTDGEELPRCVEMYGGVGTIGLNCLDLVSFLSCSDENPHNKTLFEKTLSRMTPELRCRAEYMSLGATAVAERGGLNGYDLVIVDPPRKGMDDEVIQAMLQMNNKLPKATTDTSTIPRVERLLYVSCGFKAFKRDAARLMGQEEIASSSASSSSSSYKGAAQCQQPRYWKLIHAEGHVLFPGSDHIETFAVFDRVS